MTAFASKKNLVASMRRGLCSNVFAHPWGVIVQVFVPGCSRRDVQVHREGTSLRVQATPLPPPFAVGQLLLNERNHAEGERQFTLGEELNFNRMTQSLHHGVLTIVIPRHGATPPQFSTN